MDRPAQRITEDSDPVRLIDEIASIFQTANMDLYVQWMEKLKKQIVGKTYDGAAKAIIECYFGYGSLLDISIGFPGDDLMPEHRNFVKLREELYNWATEHEGVL